MASPTPAPRPKAQPKVVQKLVLRTLILVVVLGTILLGIRYYRDSRADPSQNESADSIGYISAIRYADDGQQAVVIKPDQSIVDAAGWKKGATDRDNVWAPSGNFVFFISDRGEDGSYQVYRWNPAKTEPEKRSVGKRGRSYPTFEMGQSIADQAMLITSGGIVMRLDPTDRSQTQVLPPVGREIAVGTGDDDNGAQSQFDAFYKQIAPGGFKYARYAADNDVIVAVMRRDEGETLVVQNMKSTSPQDQQPIVLAAGDSIDFDVNQADGSIIYSVLNFQWPDRPPAEFIKNGKVTKPFRNYIGYWKKGEAIGPPVVASADDLNGFGAIAINPDGKDFVVVSGPVENGSVSHKGLITFPTKSGSGREGKLILQGEIYEPSWDPTGAVLVYAKRENGKRTIFTANRDGSSERNLTGDKGDFASPRFSPQTK